MCTVQVIEDYISREIFPITCLTLMVYNVNDNVRIGFRYYLYEKYYVLELNRVCDYFDLDVSTPVLEPSRDLFVILGGKVR